MIKTEIEVEQEFFNAIKKTSLAKEIKGKVYKEDMRPFNSMAEDINVIVSDLDVRQLQEGVITLVTFIPLIGSSGNGEKLPNKKRIGELEKLYIELPNELTKLLPDYNGISLYSSLVSRTDRKGEYSYISAKIKFTFLTI